VSFVFWGATGTVGVYIKIHPSVQRKTEEQTVPAAEDGGLTVRVTSQKEILLKNQDFEKL
jgi:hypothetical protein